MKYESITNGGLVETEIYFPMSDRAIRALRFWINGRAEGWISVRFTLQPSDHGGDITEG